MRQTRVKPTAKVAVFRTLILQVLFLTLSHGVCWAQDETPPSAPPTNATAGDTTPQPAQRGAAVTDEELAKRYYTLGEELYNRADYRGALTQFQQAYQYSQRPALLHNIARCHELLAQPDSAIEFYEKYLASNPDDAQSIRFRIENLRGLAAQKHREQRADQAEKQQLAELERIRQERNAVANRWRTRRIVAWSLTGAGAAFVVLGGVFSGLAASKASELEQANKDGKDFSEFGNDESRGKRFAAIGVSGLVIGAAAAATGAGILVWYYAARPVERAWILPSIGEREVALTAGISF